VHEGKGSSNRTLNLVQGPVNELLQASSTICSIYCLSNGFVSRNRSKSIEMNLIRYSWRKIG